MDKLKPCPFCGGEIKVCRGIEPEITGILCKECKAMIRWEIHMKGRETFGENQEKWSAKWNRRADNGDIQK